MDYSQIVYKRKRDDAKSNQGKIHNSPHFSPSGRKSNWRPVFVRQIQLPFKSRVTEVLSSESLPSYKHISGERKVISEGGFQIQEGVLGKKLGGSK